MDSIGSQNKKFRVTMTTIPDGVVILTRDFVTRAAAYKYAKAATRMNTRSTITTIKS